jgi:2-C-methyl-D-erythritol 4-phosphate cytidylyltransferase
VRVVAIVVAAGTGERLGLGMPKAFVEVDGHAMLELAVAAASAAPGVSSVVAVVPSDAVGAAVSMLDPRVAVVAGGATRQASVRAGLLAVGEPPEAIAVHDAARPFAGAELFVAVLDALDRWDGAVPVVPVSDTVKRVDADGAVVRTEPREELAFAQTPQAFRAPAIAEAHERAALEHRDFTDDAACLEWAGFRVGVVEGDEANFKITTLDDLRRATALAEARRG